MLYTLICLHKVSANTTALTCPSCTSSMVNPRMLACGHIFCDGCAVVHMNNTKPCDICQVITGIRTSQS